MTDQATIESLQAELARLKTHAEDLLAERKAEKQRREAAETALQTLTEAHSATITQLDDLTLTGPVLRALESVTAAPPVQGKKLLEEAGIVFQVGKLGTPIALDGDQEIPLPDLYRHLAKKCDTADGLKAYGWLIKASGASGSGAVGGSTINPHSTPKEPTVIKQLQKLGLR